jgi:hypothetical protein
MLSMRFAKIWWTDFGCTVRMNDGGEDVSAWPHQTADYNLIAHRCGYGYDILAYCREHEFCHLFVEQEFHRRPSFILHSLANGYVPSGREAAYEELMAQSFQRFLRANERPMIGGVKWDDLKARALHMLATLDYSLAKGTEAA